MDKLDLKDVNIKIFEGDLRFPKKVGEWREEASLIDAVIELEFDADQLDDEYLTGILEERGFYVSEFEPDIGNYSDTEIQRAAENRGFYVADEEPREVQISHFSTQDLKDELEYRDGYLDLHGAAWYLQAGKLEDFLIHLERANPEIFSNLSNYRLVKK